MLNVNIVDLAENLPPRNSTKFYDDSDNNKNDNDDNEDDNNNTTMWWRQWRRGRGVMAGGRRGGKVTMLDLIARQHQQWWRGKECRTRTGTQGGGGGRRRSFSFGHGWWWKKEEKGVEGKRGGRAGGLLYQALCRGLQGHFGGKNWIFAPEMPWKSPQIPPPQGWGKFGAVGVLSYDVIPRAIPQISPHFLSLNPLYYGLLTIDMGRYW
jgi:hypothetical protein